MNTLIIKREKENTYKTLEPYTFDELLSRIELGEQDEDNGVLLAHESVMAGIKQKIDAWK